MTLLLFIALFFHITKARQNVTSSSSIAVISLFIPYLEISVNFLENEHQTILGYLSYSGKNLTKSEE